MNQETVLCKNIYMKYQSENGETEAIKDISFEIAPKEFVSLIGPSGCGKSTLLSIIAGLIAPTSGEVYVNGKNVALQGANIGYMPQKDSLLPFRTIWQNVLLGLEIKKIKTIDNMIYADELLDTYGLKQFKNKYPRQLSGGMRQRCALIRTLVIRPDILLLDEAFSALDYQTRLEVRDDVQGIIKNERKTALLVTHDISEAIALSDKVIVLSARPAHVVAEHDIPFGDGSPKSRRNSPEFAAMFETLRGELGL